MANLITILMRLGVLREIIEKRKTVGDLEEMLVGSVKINQCYQVLV